MLVLSALAARGQGTMVYDQQSATNRSVSGGAVPFEAEQPAGQSFTPTLSSVAFVQFEFYDPSPGNGVGATVYVNLRADSLSGTILGSSDPVTMPDSFFFGVTNFFFGTPVTVAPGITYYLQPILQSGENLWSIVDGSYSYAGGTFFFNGAPNPNGYNAWFREGILTPEPSSGVLLLVGAAGLYLAGRLRPFGRKTLLLVLGVAGASFLAAASTYLPRAPTSSNYLSAQHPEWPPMPCPTTGCAATPIPGQPRCWLMLDQDYDYSALQAALSMATPMGVTPQSPGPMDYGASLWLEIAQPIADSLPLTAHNVDVSKWFQLLSTTNMEPHPSWAVEQQVQQPASTDLPLTVSENARPKVFFRAAQSDTLVSITSGGDLIRPNECYSSQPGYFYMQRNVTSGLYPAMTVCYQISGTATNGVDYTYLSSSTTIPEGNLEWPIEVDALPSLCGSNLTLTVTLVATNGYLVDTNAASATMLIYANVFEQVASVSWNPVGLAYDPPTQSLLASAFAQYEPYFWRIDGNGAVTHWAGAPVSSPGVSIGTVNVTAHSFVAGDLYYDSQGVEDSGQNPSIGWVSANGSQEETSWVTLPPPWSGLGGLYVDQSGVFGGDLIATEGGDYAGSSGRGRVWRITAARQVTQITDLGTPLCELITLTNDVAQWGPWAGKIITGQAAVANNNPEIYAIDTNGVVTTNYLGIQPESFNLIPPNQSFYCLDPDDNMLWKVPAGVFAGHAGQLLVTGTGQPPALYIVQWGAAAGQLVVEEISMPPLSGFEFLEEGAFAPIEIPCQ